MQESEGPSVQKNQAGFRFDEEMHRMLMEGERRTPVAIWEDRLRLPQPVFPQYPEKLGDVEPDPKYLPKGENPYRTRVTSHMVHRVMRGWLYPYLWSRILPGEYHPIIAYLFTEWKCNLDCHYCWSTENSPVGRSGIQVGIGNWRRLCHLSSARRQRRSAVHYGPSN